MVEMSWGKFEAYQALTQIGKLYVENLVDTIYSLVAKIEKNMPTKPKIGRLITPFHI